MKHFASLVHLVFALALGVAYIHVVHQLDVVDCRTLGVSHHLTHQSEGYHETWVHEDLAACEVRFQLGPRQLDGLDAYQRNHHHDKPPTTEQKQGVQEYFDQRLPDSPKEDRP